MGYVYASKIISLTDSSFIIAGARGSDERLFLISCINDQGTLLWSKSFSLERNSVLTMQALVKANNTSFIITGTVGTDKAAFFMKMDDQANLVWFKKLDTTSEATDIARGKNSFYITGNIQQDILLIKIDTKGNIVYTKQIGTDKEDKGYKIVATNDGGVFIAGTTNAFTSIQNPYLIKLDAEGALQWAKAVALSDTIRILSAYENRAGNFGVYINNYHTVPEEMSYVVQADKNGVVCNNAGSGANIKNINTVAVKGNGSTKDVGIEQEAATSVFNVNLVVSNICTGSLQSKEPLSVYKNIDVNTPGIQVKIIANPVKGSTLKVFVTQIASPYQVTIVSADGRQLISTQLAGTGDHYFTLNIASLQNGIYYLKVIMNGRQYVQKFIKAG
ncbi:hypothetical protein BH10BAC2_BH10BAC2_11340 [soil metagenome]